MNELAIWLAGLRREAKLSLAALAEKTKIMGKHLEALEGGELSALPSPVHARAFAIAFARACGADDDEAMEKVAAAFGQKAPLVVAPAKNDAPAKSSAPAAPKELSSAEAVPQEPVGPAQGPLPWKLWALVAAGAVAFLLLLHGAVSCVRSAKEGQASAAVASGAVAAAGTPSTQAEPVSPTAAPDELSLCFRRPCWVLLVIDGKRLPVVFLERDKRERWMVRDKAVMLAGNIGAVRVWWRGDNLGYFGGLGERMNGVIFENGKPWRHDAAADLPLPSGVPSKASP